MTEEIKTAAWRHLEAGDLAAAADLFQQLTNESPFDAEPLVGLGKTYERAGEISLAVKAFKEAAGRDASCFDANHRLGVLLLNHYGHNRSVKFLSRAAAIDPASDVAWTDLGAAYNAGGNIEAAVKSWRRAVKLNPRAITARTNLASALRETGSPNKALALLHETLDIDPDSIAARTLAASIYSDLNQIGKATSLLGSYLSKHPENAECLQTLSLIQLRAGMLEEGFENYESRFAPSRNGVQTRSDALPEWEGKPLNDERLLVWLEQGLGDEILALSLMGDILKRAPSCAIECDERLVSLVSRSFPTANVIAKSDPRADDAGQAAYACAALSTARFFRRNWSDLPTRPGYLTPHPDKVETLKRRYEEIAQGRKIVGLSWTSNALGGRRKSPPIEDWSKILDAPDRLFVSVQYDPSWEDLEALSRMTRSEVFVDPDVDVTRDIDTAAAQLSALDRVISISNTSAHLAGAIGVPTAVLVPEGYGGFWYWHRHTTESAWYRSVTICRQSEAGQWGNAMAAAENWLSN